MTERERFERVFPVPASLVWEFDRYIPRYSSFSDTCVLYNAKWEGWQAARAASPKVPQEQKLNNAAMGILENHECQKCAGIGLVDSFMAIPNEYTTCPACNGDKYIPKPRTLPQGREFVAVDKVAGLAIASGRTREECETRAIASGVYKAGDFSACVDGEPFVTVTANHEDYPDEWRGFSDTDWSKLHGLPVGTNLYLQAPSSAALPQGVEKWIAEKRVYTRDLEPAVQIDDLMNLLSGMALVPVEIALQKLADADKCIRVFDDGGDGADDESARKARNLIQEVVAMLAATKEKNDE